ncbi:UDP-2,4-diacetamido-2,4,6-trideoxy-beta-L-altropyranose hydrolase [Cohaesibacter sp. CAU 1516]|uniref:UDP-2,4-diacetamido-2,4, 6-trideoxy-beta-L-altropyranose hydrolase n=1 Tax=Cohaesibacter sp. CAU 1516 TaxID=2576038 RepID=UPI0010FDD5BD|nr:UDP-2,4-diacetamido-2,4,6-trideoxy-beta-L-altropyranose hydrolase [Cohaesibacter sp. CAU 1516]TLP42093.1 UDP-2,4-diacetamido-2,4,6-trideoxy-beta-L-altropyranose hydrolase [Cohaesibacter sp. CAU 1516]
MLTDRKKDAHIVFRVDASLEIGTGHVVRCMVLARKLRSCGVDCHFVCKNLPGNIADSIIDNGFTCRLIEPVSDVFSEIDELADLPPHAAWLHGSQGQDAYSFLEAIKDRYPDWIIVDHYGLDYRWEMLVRSSCGNIMVIDDLADRKHDCNILLDQNFFSESEERYSGLVPSESRLMVGPRFALLTESFEASHSRLLPYAERFEKGHIVVFFGGVDLINQTTVACRTLLKNFMHPYKVDVIVGRKNPHIHEIEATIGNAEHIDLHVQVRNMEHFLERAFLYVGAIGTTTWERCACHLPGLVCSVAGNQKKVAVAVRDYGSHIYLGHYTDMSPEIFERELVHLLPDFNRLRTLSERSSELVDAQGCSRVAKQLLGLI